MLGASGSVAVNAVRQAVAQGAFPCLQTGASLKACSIRSRSTQWGSIASGQAPQHGQQHRQRSAQSLSSLAAPIAPTPERASPDQDEQAWAVQMIVRAHECVMDGFERFAQGHLITLFSATNYCGTAGNAGMPCNCAPQTPFRMHSPGKRTQTPSRMHSHATQACASDPFSHAQSWHSPGTALANSVAPAWLQDCCVTVAVQPGGLIKPHPLRMRCSSSAPTAAAAAAPSSAWDEGHLHLPRSGPAASEICSLQGHQITLCPPDSITKVQSAPANRCPAQGPSWCWAETWSWSPSSYTRSPPAPPAQAA